MGENNYTKLLYFLGFVVLAIISCWATSESFQLLLPTWPSVFCWLLTIAFFIIASIGSKLIVESCDQNVYMEKRGTKFVAGIILMILFWIICSVPTNTHTFFYRSYIDQKVSTDIASTQGYLAQIKNNVKVDQLVKKKQLELEKNVNIRLGELKAEIENDANPGYGPKAKEILASFAEILSVPKIDPLTYKGTSVQDRQKLYEAYRRKIYTLMDTKKENIKLALNPANKEYKKIAKTDYNNIERLKNYIQNGTISLNDPQGIKQVCDQLNKGYSTIKNYKDYVAFQNNEDKDRFTADNPETRVRRMLNVYDVWVDFLHGDFPGSFIFWIIISILVDIAAFIFFDLAFKKTY